MEKQSVTVRIRGREFRVRSADEADSIHRVAEYLDQTMAEVEQRTGAIDSLDVAMLTALNLARELVEIREAGGTGPTGPRVQKLIELAESALVRSATPA